MATKPITRRTGRLVCVIASAGVLVATVVAVGATTPGYDPLADAVSRLGSPDEPHAVFIRAGFVVYGLLIVAGARPLGEVATAKERLLAFLIGGFGVAAVVAGLAPKDPPGGVHTLTSQVHVAATIVGGAMLLTAMAIVTYYAPRRSDRLTAAVVGAITTVGVIVFPFMWGSSIYGLIELALLTMATGWLVSLAASALRSRREAVRAAGSSPYVTGT